MFEVEIYGRVRRAVRVEGKSQRAVAREFGLSRETVRKMLQYAVPRGYQRQQSIRRPKLGPWLGVIDAILNDDRQRPVKQRHTSKRIFERLKEEHGFTGGYTIVKDYVRTATLRGQEMFVPLVHPAGEAQVDFGEALVVVVAGVEHKAHYLAMDLPHSDDCFVAAFPAETIGVIAGLAEAGIDMTEAADLVIGTSSGATAAAQVRSRRIPPADLLASVLSPAGSTGRTEPARAAVHADGRRPRADAGHRRRSHLGCRSIPCDGRVRLGEPRHLRTRGGGTTARDGRRQVASPAMAGQADDRGCSQRAYRRAGCVRPQFRR
jgi:transposase